MKSCLGRLLVRAWYLHAIYHMEIVLEISMICRGFFYDIVVAYLIT